MISLPTLVAKLWRYGYGALGSEYYQGADGVEVELPIGTEGQVKTVVSGVPAWATATGGTGGVDPSAVSGLAGLVASKAPLLSPNFLGTPKKNGVALATTADITSAGVDPAETAGLRGMVAGKAPVLSPVFLGIPKVPTASPGTSSTVAASTAYVDAAVAAVGSVDASAIAWLQGLVAAKAPLLSPRFIGTPTKNGVALATTADIPATADPSSDQFILGTQIFGS